ncbi:MAG: hypothetical protein NTY86_12830 [Deltaproteobacteria bacterium]|nr:hypothetical protein [Deltaproteobacteria bacterium]
MDCAVLTDLNTLKGTYSGLGKTRQTKYEVRITSQVTCQTLAATMWETQKTKEFKPKTEFVKKLLALREQAILNGMKLLTVDEILVEKQALRGEIN